MESQLHAENVSNDCVHFGGLTTAIQLTDYVLLICGLFSCVGHTAVLAVAFMFLRHTNDAVLHLIIVTTSLYDVFLTGLIYPAAALLRLSAGLRSHTFCNVVQIAMWGCVTSTSLSTVLLAFDRLLYFRAPDFYRALTKTAVIATSIAVFVLCVGLVGALWVFQVATANDACTLEIRASRLVAYDLFVAGFYVLPILVAVAVGTYMFLAVYKRRNHPEFPALPSRPTPKMASLSYLMVSATLAAITLLPNTCVIAWRAHHTTMAGGCPSESVLVVAWVLRSLMRTHPIARPFVLFAFLRPYWKELKLALFRSPQSDTRGWFDV